MSLKQYNPHLQLTIHKPTRLVLGLRLLSCWMVGMLLINQLGSFYLLLSCTAVLAWQLLVEHSLVCTESVLTLNEYVLGWGKEEYELRALKLLFGYFVLILFRKGRSPLCLSRDQFSRQDWQCLVRYSKLALIDK